ncbi:bifunctional riboflavin kinase/FAD synthetase [Oscillatoria sp. FACHB-1406]|uniref:bifunctional riboflavin kinase/FAD synthetase n=1 Tax=Oscillatoria sp. FACHB-1406 TaxID=2692846 RepID=UPI001682DE62|nr:bifunctional riboflavin kinase/FAD synthetase [Oscillatoria sp. FACHB-1406]
MWVTSSTATALTPTAIALGNFDGVHLGHCSAIAPIIHYSAASDRSLLTYPTVVTFNPHPQEFFTGKSKALLTPLEEKVQQLEALGVRQLILLPFDRELAALSPEAFVSKILVEQLGAKLVAIGADFRFGAKRTGTAQDLQAIAQNYGVEVAIATLKSSTGDSPETATPRISSSAIRQALLDGKLEQANRLLGRPYSFIGTVVTGQQLGRTIGFPTANLQVPPNKLLPHYGVYSVKVILPSQQTLLGVANIGCRPTVDGSTAPTIEIHLLDWSGDLYGQTLTVHLMQFLRPEQKFSSLDALKAQIAIDCQAAILMNSE